MNYNNDNNKKRDTNASASYNSTSHNSTTSSGGKGFASMDENKQREIASMGGKAAHAGGNAHEFTSEEAREAGKMGGASRRENRSEQNNTDNT